MFVTTNCYNKTGQSQTHQLWLFRAAVLSKIDFSKDICSRDMYRLQDKIRVSRYCVFWKK